MDYVEGKNLKDLGFRKDRKWCHPLGKVTEATEHLHRQLADVYVQLRQLQFTSIGALGLPCRKAPYSSIDPDTIKVRNRPLFIEMALQEIDGIDPGRFMEENKTFRTTKEFVEAVLCIADNEVDREPDQGLEGRGMSQILFASHHYKRFIREKWLEAAGNEGPFVLMHGDLTSMLANLLFDDNLNLVAIVDWEWSQVVPAQMLVPPAWIRGFNADFVLISMRAYVKEAHNFLSAVRQRELEMNSPPVLSSEWAKIDTWCHTVIVIALFSPSFSTNVFWDYLFFEMMASRPGKDEDFLDWWRREVVPRLDNFMESSPDLLEYVTRKEMEQRDFFEQEKEYFNLPKARSLARPKDGL